MRGLSFGVSSRGRPERSSKRKLREASLTDVDDELTGNGRGRLSEVELGKRGLVKKGFAHRE